MEKVQLNTIENITSFLLNLEKNKVSDTVILITDSDSNVIFAGKLVDIFTSIGIFPSKTKARQAIWQHSVAFKQLGKDDCILWSKVSDEDVICFDTNTITFKIGRRRFVKLTFPTGE